MYKIGRAMELDKKQSRFNLCDINTVELSLCYCYLLDR